MSPDEVIVKLNAIGVEISRATLLRYEKQVLIPEPKRGGGGAGGRWTDYPEGTVEEAYAAWSLLHGKYGDDMVHKVFGGKCPILSPDAIKQIREMQYIFKLYSNNDKISEEQAAEDFKNLRKIMKQFGEAWGVLNAFGSIWISEVKKAQRLLLSK